MSATPEEQPVDDNADPSAQCKYMFLFLEYTESYGMLWTRQNKIFFVVFVLNISQQCSATIHQATWPGELM